MFTIDLTTSEIQALKSLIDTRLDTKYSSEDLTSHIKNIRRKLSSATFTHKIDLRDTERILLEVAIVGDVQNTPEYFDDRGTLIGVLEKLKKGRKSHAN